MATYDAVIIGGGHNGLAAGVVLADAGWKVLVLERNDAPGGAVRTEEVTLPGFRHDLMAMNLNLFAGSQFFAEYGDRLRAHGLSLVPSSRPVVSVFPDGSHVGISTDLEETLSSIRAVSAADADAYEDLFEHFGRIAPHVFPLLGVPLPSVAAVRAMVSGTRALGRRWPLDLARLVFQSSRELVDDHFESPQVRALTATWGMHLDFPPDMAGGALFPYLETMAAQANGMVIGEGGAANMIDASVGLLESLGGDVRCRAEVDGVLVHDGVATGVTLDGEHIGAERAVIANLTPTRLFGDLVEPDAVPADFLRKVRRYRYGPGTVMVHLALSDLPDWQASPTARDHAYVHVAGYIDDMARTYQQAMEGLLPTTPTLVVGQPTTVDPGRAPDGNHVLWVQVRMVPSRIGGDAAGEISATTWSDAKEPFADRVMAILEEHAPGLGEKVLARTVMSPDDLEAANPNLVGGDQLGGSHHLMQHFLLRPLPGWSRYSTPVERLHMCGSATWPGAGVGAGSGMLLGRQLTSESWMARLRR